MSSHPLADSPIWTAVVEARLTAAGLPLTAWHEQVAALTPRQRASEELMRQGEQLLDAWRALLAAAPTINTTQIRGQRAFFQRISERIFPRQHDPPLWEQTVHLLSNSTHPHADSAHMAHWQASRIPGFIANAVAELTRELTLLRREENHDRIALCVLEAQSDLPVALVNIIAQYLDRDFERRPHVSIYKQLA